MPRAIDHLVLAVHDLAQAVARYRAMGFTVGAQNRHPWGTVNAIVGLEGGPFLELIGLGPGFAVPTAEDPAAPFALPVAAAVARGGGLAMVALRSEDADADAEMVRSFGLGDGGRLDFERTAEDAAGLRRPVRFSLAFVEDLRLGEAGVFTCRHRDADATRRPEAPRHPNGAARLASVTLVAERPASHANALTMLLGTAASGGPERPSFALADARLDVTTAADALARHGIAAAPGRFALVALTVASLDRVRVHLDAARLPHHSAGGAVVVPPESCFGAAMAFVEAP